MRMFTEEEERVIKILLQRVFHSECVQAEKKRIGGNGHCRISVGDLIGMAYIQMEK
jgi:hypothetical protein